MPVVINGTTGISGVDGGAATPAYQGTDTNTGMFFPAADTIAFAEGGAEVARFDSSGNLGIGTSSPGYRLDVNGIINGNNSIISRRASGSQPEFVLTQTGVASWSIYNPPSSTDLRFYNGTDLLTMTSVGNLGLGVTPSAWLSAYKGMQFGSYGAVYSTNNATVRAALSTNAFINTSNTYTYTANGVALAYVQDNGGHAWLTAPSGTAGNAISFTQAMTLDASGNLLVGTTSSFWSAANRGVVEVNGGSTAIYGLKVGNNAAGYIYHSGSDMSVWNLYNNALQFGTNNTERARIDSNGALLVGATSQPNPGFTSRIAAVQPNANAIASMDATNASGGWGIIMRYTASAPNGTGNDAFSFQDSSATRFTVRSNGGIANFQANNVNLSDRREKTNFAPAGEYLSKICAIPVQTFNYIDQNMEDDPGLTLGVVAQDVQAVAPELVMESNWGTEENPKMRLSIYQTDLQYALMKCIQELKAELDTVKTELAALKGTA